VLKLFSPPQTFRQSFNYSSLKHTDLLFTIFTLQNSYTDLWLKLWLQLALPHIQYSKTFQLCDMCTVLGLSSTGILWCSISVQSDTLPPYPIPLTHFATLPHSSHTLCHITPFLSHIHFAILPHSSHTLCHLNPFLSNTLPPYPVPLTHFATLPHSSHTLCHLTPFLSHTLPPYPIPLTLWHRNPYNSHTMTP
jgi:hypothetical protein